MSASLMTSAPDVSAPSVVMADTAAVPEPSFDFLTASRFWLLFREYFCGDLLPPLEVFPVLDLFPDGLPCLGAGGFDL